MALVERSPPVFETTCNLPPGIHQYRFLVDGVWRIDEQQPCISDEYGMVNNAILIDEPNVSSSMASPSNHHPPEQVAWISDADLGVSRLWVSRLLSSRTIYDILPMSSKLFIIDVQLPVKQAFHIMYEEGLLVVPLWDDSRSNITGMLTASDFIIILKELQNNFQMLAEEELERHSVSAWKESKLQLYRNNNASVGAIPRPLIHVSDLEYLNDAVLKILQNEISMVPIFKSSLQEDFFMPLLNLAGLSGILKYICIHFAEDIGSVPFLRYPISAIPLGTWLPGSGRFSGRQLAMLQRDAPFHAALDLLLEAKVSSIPIVDDNGTLIDLYSRSDIMALAKDDTYSHIRLDQITVEQALEQVNRANVQDNGRRQCHTCVRSASLHEIMERLSDPGVRRLVVVDARSRRVEGIISLRDVFKFLIGWPQHSL